MKAQLFHADGHRQTGRRTDMTTLIVAFRSFTNVLKEC
jgi:hypothetical protein